MNRRFEGKTALITAAAGGIGRATCERMAREGARVAAIDVDAQRLESMVSHCRREGLRVDVYPADALSVEEVPATVDKVHGVMGRIDILVNAVGGSTGVRNPNASIEELTPAEWQSLIDFNLNSMFLFCHAVVPIMKSQRSGKIVNLSSIAGRGISVASSIGYAAGKGGVNAFTKKLSLELGAYNINVNAIAPSLTLTERIQPFWEKRSEAQREAVRMQVPLRRLPRAEDQASVICFLASPDADFVTGLSVDVTGGQ